MSLDYADSEREISEVYSLISKRNEELASRKETPQIPIPPDFLVDVVVKKGHNAGEIVDQLTEDRKDPWTYQMLRRVEQRFSPQS